MKSRHCLRAYFVCLSVCLSVCLLSLSLSLSLSVHASESSDEFYDADEELEEPPLSPMAGRSQPLYTFSFLFLSLLFISLSPLPPSLCSHKFSLLCLTAPLPPFLFFSLFPLSLSLSLSLPLLSLQQ